MLSLIITLIDFIIANHLLNVANQSLSILLWVHSLSIYHTGGIQVPAQLLPSFSHLNLQFWNWLKWLNLSTATHHTAL